MCTKRVKRIRGLSVRQLAISVRIERIQVNVSFSPDSLKPRSHLKIAGREVEVTFEQLISSEWLGKGSFGSVSAVKLGADPTLTIAVKVRASSTVDICLRTKGHSVV